MSTALLSGEKPPIIAQYRSRAGSWPVVRALLAYLLAVFLGAALVAPWIHMAVHAFAPDSFLARYPFHRHVSRLLLLFALAGLWPLARDMRRLGIVPAPLGLVPARMHHWLHGFVWGFGSLALAIGLALAFGARVPDLAHSPEVWLKMLKNAALAAMLAGFIEEFLFRGALFGGLRRREDFLTAAVLSSLFYAILHFFERPQTPYHIHWHSGLVVLAQMLRGFGDWQALIPGLLNLTLVGAILCLAFERTRSILFSFGMHAGLIFWVKASSFSTKPAPGANHWFWGGDKVVDGWITFGLLAAVCWGLHRTLRASDHDAERFV
jgi:membrane protease YdiL (CAAX protease family)